LQRDEIERQVIEAASTAFHQPADQIHLETRFKEDLLAKSLNVFMMLALLKVNTGVELSFAKAAQNETIGDAVDMIEKILQG